MLLEVVDKGRRMPMLVLPPRLLICLKLTSNLKLRQRMGNHGISRFAPGMSME
jgi:hypothetical protein